MLWVISVAHARSNECWVGMQYRAMGYMYVYIHMQPRMCVARNKHTMALGVQPRQTLPFPCATGGMQQ